MGPRSNSGFTLIELMIVVIITAVLLSYAVPGISRTMADRRAATVLSEIVRIGKRARAAAETNRPAHLVLIRPGGDGTNGGRGLVQLLRGTSGRCDAQDWVAAAALCPPVARPVGMLEPCPEHLDMNSNEWWRDPFEIRVRMVAAANVSNLAPLLEGGSGLPLAICYEQTGATYWSTAPLAVGMAFNQLAAGAAEGGGFLFTVGVYSTAENRVANVPRVLAFPLGAVPRRVR